MPKSLYATYGLWLGGGWLGIHHLYLGRDYHWFLWFTSAGGFFLGHLIDAVRIPSYVGQANQSPAYLESWQYRRGLQVRRIQVSRWIGALAFSIYYQTVVLAAIGTYFVILPTALLLPILSFFRAISGSIAVLLTFSLGEKKVENPWLITLAAISSELTTRVALYPLVSHRVMSLFFDHFSPPDLVLIAVPFLVTAMVANYFQRYRQEPSGHRMMARACFIVTASSIWLLLSALAVYNHLDLLEDSPDPRRLFDENYRLVRFDQVWDDLKAVGVVAAVQNCVTRLSTNASIDWMPREEL